MTEDFDERSEQRRLRVAFDLATAEHIRRLLLPRPPEGVTGWQFHARVEPCKEVGGDLYDFHRRGDGQLAMMVGDVSGKGLGAAILMASVLSSARALYDTAESPLQMADKLNEMLVRSIAPGYFVRVFLAFIEPPSGRVRFINAGHNPPLVFSRGSLSTLEDGGVPMGILPSYPFVQGETTLLRGDLLAAFSDGIPDAAREGQFFGDDRLREALVGLAANPDLGRVADGIVLRVQEFTQEAPRTDDITLVLARRL